MSVQQLSPTAWLAQADTDPGHAYEWWIQNPDELSMLPLGSLFDVVKTAAATGQRLLARLDDTERRSPSFVNSGIGTMYFLVPPGTSSTWRTVPGADCLGAGTWLWVPVPTRIQRDGTYWAQPPDGTGVLHDPQALATALMAVRGAP